MRVYNSSKTGLLLVLLLLSLWKVGQSLGSRKRHGDNNWTYIVSLLLILISLLIGGSLGVVGSALLLVESLPSLTEDLADLTEGHIRVVVTDALALLVGEEHVGGETTLRGVGVYQNCQSSPN